MKEWCLIHYNMTFWVILFALYIIGVTIENIIKAIVIIKNNNKGE